MNALGAVSVLFGVLLMFSGLMIVALVLAAHHRGPSTSEREAVQEAPPRFVGRAVVAGSDLDPLEVIWRMPAYDGERAS